MRYAGEPGPATVFAKAHTARHRIVHLRNGNLFNEARLFASGAELPLEHPLVYYATIDRLRLDFLLRSEEHTSELQSLMRISYAVFCLKKKKHKYTLTISIQ